MRQSATRALALALPMLPALAQPEDGLDLEALERLGIPIGEINIRVEDVFDLDNPEEDKVLYRFANRLHIQTRKSTVESVLLFERGDRFEARVLDESARALRATGYVAETEIKPTNFNIETNTVDIDVFVKDSWSLSPDLKLSRNGGANEYGFGISEDNLFGLGKSLTLSFKSDVDRDERLFEYEDSNVHGTRARLATIYSDASDGYRRGLSVDRPFYALDSRWSMGGRLVDDKRVDSVYSLGEVIDKYTHKIRRMSVEGGWSRGLVDNRSRRWLVGITEEEDIFFAAEDFPDTMLLPEDRRFTFPWVGFQLIEDDFREMTELNDIGRTEDVPLGLNLIFRLGQATESLNSTRDATIFRMSAHKGWEPGGGGNLFLFDFAASTRREEGETRNSILTASFDYYHRNLEKHLFTASLKAVLGAKLDADNQVLLGGDTGLRGFPLRYQSGERSAVFSVEQRFFTEWYPFRLIRVGYAVFFDIGRVWGVDVRNSPTHGTLYDIGVGLRLTSPRSSTRSVLHIDLSTPLNGPDGLDSLQLSIEKRSSF
jgi:outer membrane protein assembly factor BamA